MAATISTSMPTKLPDSSVYSKGMNAVSVVMIHFLSVPDAAEAAPEDAAEDTVTEDAVVDAELPQPVKNAAPKAAAAAINVLLFIRIILSVKIPSICRLSQ